MNNKSQNHALLKYICHFVDDLLKEVLERRCDLNDFFYLPGLPVLDEELKTSLTYNASFPQASSALCEQWQGLSEHLRSGDARKDSPRMLQLCYLYDIEELWLLALILTYVYQLEPKYEKTFFILQGDTGRKAPDVFLISAFAHYLGLEHSAMSLRCECRVKNELFELYSDGQLFL